MNVSALGFAVLFVAAPLLGAPDDMDTAFQNLKEAEAKKDAAQVKKLAAETCALAREERSRPAPEDPAQKEVWTKRVAMARDVEVYTEYALFATAVQAPPATTVDLLAALERQNPKSKYLADAYARYFQVLNQTGAAAKIPDIAEKAVAHFPDNPDLLNVLATTAIDRKQTARAGVYAERLLAALGRSKKPEGVSQADWDRGQTAARGRAAWVAGIAHSESKEYFQADPDLRAALPLIKGNEQMLAAALFHLGLVNYQIGRLTLSKARVLEAARFSDQAAAIKSPFAEQAWRNGGVMRAEAAKMR